jgi:hypothetical protein
MQRTDKAPRLCSAVVPPTLKQKKSHNADICNSEENQVNDENQIGYE